MSKATVFSGAQFGLADETAATGLFVASITWSGTSETAELPDHIGCAVGLSVYNPKKDVSCDGVIAVKANGLGDTIGSAITLANTTSNSRTRNSEGLGLTPNGAAAIIITGNTISPTQNGFEGGGISGVFLPFVSTTSPAELT
jgi:hypothetical protein